MSPFVALLLLVGKQNLLLLFGPLSLIVDARLKLIMPSIA